MEGDMITETSIKKVLQGALDLGASYADIRVKDILKENLCYENGVLTNSSTNRSHGYGVRVFVDGSMGFAASSTFDQMEETVKKAYEIALASRTLQSQKINLTKKSAAKGSYRSPMEKDPFIVPLSEKLELMKSCTTNMHKAWEEHEFSIKPTFFTYVTLDFRRDDVIFADSDGSFIDQSFCQSATHTEARVIAEDDS